MFCAHFRVHLSSHTQRTLTRSLSHTHSHALTHQRVRIGSPHFHSLLWCKDQPDISSVADPLADTQAAQDLRNRIVEFVDRCGLCATYRDDILGPPNGNWANVDSGASPENLHPTARSFGDLQRLIGGMDRDIGELINSLQQHTPCFGDRNASCQRTKANNETYCRFFFFFFFLRSRCLCMHRICALHSLHGFLLHDVNEKH